MADTKTDHEQLIATLKQNELPHHPIRSDFCSVPRKEAVLFLTYQCKRRVLELTSSCRGSKQGQGIYLAQYGYIPKIYSESGYLLEKTSFATAVADFQRFAGINVTGEVDKETLITMTLPRCGIKDKMGTGSAIRSKRYARQGRRWKSKNLRYKIINYPSTLGRYQVDDEIQRAFNVWTEYTDLTFSPSRSQADIKIRFKSGEHGDGDPFDGMGGQIAHALFPVDGSDAHFDASEQWSVDVKSGINLFQVAAHEFGHSLGLLHSDVKSALMSPFYRGYQPYFSLDQDDVDGIQSLYGKKTRIKRESPSVPASGTDVQGPLEV